MDQPKRPRPGPPAGAPQTAPAVRPAARNAAPGQRPAAPAQRAAAPAQRAAAPAQRPAAPAQRSAAPAQSAALARPTAPRPAGTGELPGFFGVFLGFFARPGVIIEGIGSGEGRSTLGFVVKSWLLTLFLTLLHTAVVLDAAARQDLQQNPGKLLDFAGKPVLSVVLYGIISVAVSGIFGLVFHALFKALGGSSGLGAAGRLTLACTGLVLPWLALPELSPGTAVFSFALPWLYFILVLWPLAGRRVYGVENRAVFASGAVALIAVSAGAYQLRAPAGKLMASLGGKLGGQLARKAPARPAAPRKIADLNPQERAFLEAQRSLALEHYKNQRFEDALREVRKTFAVIPDYNGTREIEMFAVEAIRRQKTSPPDAGRLPATNAGGP